MRRFLPVLLLTLLLTPIQSSDAASCRQVADLNEQLRIAGIRDSSYGLNSKVSIAFTVKVYKAVYQNQSCVSSFRASEVKSGIKAIQSACKSRKTSDPGYLDWKRSERDYWGGIYGKNFSYACSQWNSIRI